MEKIGIDIVSPESFEAFLELTFYTTWSDVIYTFISSERIPIFCDDPDIFPRTFECFSEKNFTLPEPVDRGGIERADSECIRIFEQ
jgi:hypothetical protein